VDVNGALPTSAWCGPAQREIVHADALTWMREHDAAEGAAVITSLPDVSELPELGFDGWRAWFVDAASAVIRWTPVSSVAIFFQSDIRHEGCWVDKGYLVGKAAEREGASLLWHKVVCRKPPGTISHGRASYAHMLAFTRSRGRPVTLTHPGPDVIADPGAMPWSKAMGVNACLVACRFLQESTTTRQVVDPFCGRGTVLAVANSLGLDAMGIDVSARRCRAARSCRVSAADGRIVP